MTNTRGGTRKAKVGKLKDSRLNIAYNVNKNKTRSKLNNLIKSKQISLQESRVVQIPNVKMTALNNGGCKVTFVELLHEIKTKSSEDNNGFSLFYIPVNPGLKQIFPWVSALADNYTTYEFSNLQFSYKPRINKTVDGNICGYIDYDPEVSWPENRKEILSRKGKETQVFEVSTFIANCNEMKTENSHYIRTGDVGKNKDLKLYDSAVFFFAYEGTPPNKIIGDLFVSYTVSFHIPKLRLADRQIRSIESCGIQTSKDNSATDAKPLGIINQVADITGDFLGTLLNTATGGIAGQFFSTGKSVLKMISSLLPHSQTDTEETGYTACNPMNANLYKLKVSPKKNYSDKIEFVDEGYTSILTEALSLSGDEFEEQYEDITSTNVFKLDDHIDITSRSRKYRWVVAFPANTILRFASASTTKPASGKPTMEITDCDPDKIYKRLTGYNKDNIVGFGGVGSYY